MVKFTQKFYVLLLKRYKPNITHIVKLYLQCIVYYSAAVQCTVRYFAAVQCIKYYSVAVQCTVKYFAAVQCIKYYSAVVQPTMYYSAAEQCT